MLWSWQVQYVWFMLLYCAYMAVLLAIGSAVNIGFFRKNSYGLQIVSCHDSHNPHPCWLLLPPPLLFVC
jgi:hypothetical protein